MTHVSVCGNEDEGHGILVPLKTTLEVRATEALLEVWVTCVPVRSASKSLDIVRRLLPGDGGVDLQHLRRFAKTEDVPSVVREALDIAKAEFSNEEKKGEPVERNHRTSASKDIATSTPNSTNISDASLSRFLIIGSTNSISHSTITKSLSTLLTNTIIFPLQVPRLAPTSQPQASLWSAKFWPTVYKKSNPFGPHPSIMSRAEDEIRGEVREWMKLAEKVAREAEELGAGEMVGVVVVERREGVGRVVAVAGDARWRDWEREGEGNGNVMAHAVMRAIAMIADKIKDAAGGGKGEDINIGPSTTTPLVEDLPSEQTNERSTEDSTDLPIAYTGNDIENDISLPIPSQNRDSTPDIFQTTPFLATETTLSTSRTSAGYLCLDLEIYSTHEPCVMCSMAMVHSRFGRVVFRHRMSRTGGLCADGGGLGHGLFWRKELNWTMLAWQWKVEGEKREEAEWHA